jgi:hypothetical protein
VKHGTFLNLLPEYPGNTDIPVIKQEISHMEHYPEIRDVSISGSVRDAITKEPVSGVRVYASVMFDDPQFHVYKTHEDGRYVFSLNDLSGEQDVFLGFKPHKTKELELIVTSDFSNLYPELNEVYIPFDSSHKKLLEEMLINWQLEKRFRVDNNINIPDQDKINPDKPVFGEDVITVKLEDYIELSSLYEVFYEIVPYVKIKEKKARYTISVRDPEQNIYYDDPMILVDYLPVFDVNEIMKIHHTKVQKIEVVNGIYMVGDHALWGVVSLQTDTKNFGGIQFPEGSVFVEYQTVTPSQMFASNEYITPEELVSRLPDFRTLLFWDPQVELSNQNTRVSFYASDHVSKYDIVVRGLTGDGRPCFGLKTIKIIHQD